MKNRLFALAALSGLILSACHQPAVNTKPGSLSEILKSFHDPTSDKVLIAAHRSMHTFYPENSLAAIQHAIDSGIDIIEIDVRQTKDGELILIHDGTVDRTADGEGRVDSYTFEQIRTLTLMREDDEDTLTHHVPTLIEALELAKGKIMVDLDIKSAPIKKLVNQVYVAEAVEGSLLQESGNLVVRLRAALSMLFAMLTKVIPVRSWTGR